MSQTAETPRSSRLHLDNVMIDRAEETSRQRGKVEACKSSKYPKYVHSVLNMDESLKKHNKNHAI